MNCFLVDYENVHANGLNGISGLSEEDTVIIFYSEKAETMTFGLHRRLNESKAQISFQRVSTGGKNALDFQLCTYLGYLICQNAQSLAAYYIVSGDSDYEALTVYWKRHNRNRRLFRACQKPARIRERTVRARLETVRTDNRADGRPFNAIKSRSSREVSRSNSRYR